jgi:predicted RecA/RadA family phage recombinase
VPGIAGGIVEYAEPGQHLTMTAGGTIVGGNIVIYSANRTVVQGTAASMLVAGVALHNAASGEKVTVATDGVWPVKAANAVSFGQRLISGATGQVDPAGAAPDARSVIGYALESIAGAATGRVKLNL